MAEAVALGGPPEHGADFHLAGAGPSVWILSLRYNLVATWSISRLDSTRPGAFYEFKVLTPLQREHKEG